MSTLHDQLAAAGVNVAGWEQSAATHGLVVLPMRSADALAVWHQLHALAPATGHHPIVVGGDHGWRALLDDAFAEWPFSIAELLSLVHARSPVARNRGWSELKAARFGTDGDQVRREEEDGELISASVRAAWKGDFGALSALLDRVDRTPVPAPEVDKARAAAIAKLQRRRDPAPRPITNEVEASLRTMRARFIEEQEAAIVRGEQSAAPSPAAPRPEPRPASLGDGSGDVGLVLVPTSDAWLTPVHVRFGGANGYPDPVLAAQHHRTWFESWGAIPFGVTADAIDFVVERPPSDAAGAEHAASAHMSAGVPGSDEAADRLVGSRLWTLWGRRRS